MRRHLHIVYVPKGLTSIAQPADISFNGPLKNYLRKIHHEYVKAYYKAVEDGNVRLNAKTGNPEKLKVPTRQICQQHIMMAYQRISAETIIHGYQKAGIVALTTDININYDEIVVRTDEMELMGFPETEVQEQIWDKLPATPLIHGVDMTLFPRISNKEVDLAIELEKLQLQLQVTQNKQ
ncbi:Conserved_hypothetical protein [Hexamita inflata]|uniref:Uncharacterized protein n=1 Tax=Hexamita inflata TaxID=28002 RepID=A0ABP1HWU4_9EUKA